MSNQTFRRPKGINSLTAEYSLSSLNFHAEYRPTLKSNNEDQNTI